MALPKVLYITAPADDFMADSLLHGLRCLLGRNVVDFPRCRYMDASLDAATRRKMHGRGFTLYGRFPEHEGDCIDRNRVWERAAQGEFDFVVFSSVWRQYALLLEQQRNLKGCNLVLIDGEDSPMVFPWSGSVLRKGITLALKASLSTRGAVRFKRERPDTWIPSTVRRWPWSVLTHLTSVALLAAIPPKEISFSIPKELIVTSIPEKTRLLFDHVVDPDTAKLLPTASTTHIYDSEVSYFRELRKSKFAVTRKRAGWDCLRHYEIASSGCVPCFRHLHHKPASCAPFGLNSSNCIAYDDPAELLDRLHSISDREYLALAESALAWARDNSTVARASSFLHAIGWPLSPGLPPES